MFTNKKETDDGTMMQSTVGSIAPKLGLSAEGGGEHSVVFEFKGCDDS